MVQVWKEREVKCTLKNKEVSFMPLSEDDNGIYYANQFLVSDVEQKCFYNQIYL